MKKRWSVSSYFLLLGVSVFILTSVSIAQAVTDTFNASGNWTAPAGVTSVDVEVWGGGGAGGGQNQNLDGGGGGGGGAYSKQTGIMVTPGSSYPVRVGTGGVGVAGKTGGAGGDSYFINSTTILAKGGAGGAPSIGTPPPGGAGGAAVSGVGAIKYSGGDGGRGRDHNYGQGGPGGSSAGMAADGTSGPDPWSTLTAAAPPVGGGIGGNGGDNKEDGYAPASGNGGGGGGSGDSWGFFMIRTGGDGAGGKVLITYTLLPAAVLSIVRANLSPTTSATVSWTVTFNQSVTGVDATAFSLVASGMSGTFISTVTGSGTTWTVTANTGIGSGTLGLNQTGPGSVVPTLNGTYTGEVYTISATPALAEYRMDELVWNGTAGEVKDSSGNGYNGQAFNSATTDNVSPPPIGTCRYGVFDNGGTITKGYVLSPLPNLPTSPTSDFTITAWIRTNNNTYSGQRILIDDEHNSAGYGFSLADSGTAGRLRFFSRNINPIILDSTYTIQNNIWYFVAAVADITHKKRIIYVLKPDGTFDSTTEAAWSGTWGTDTGPVSIGAETNASGEQPGSGFHFHGNLDEVRVYPKVLSQDALTAIAAQTHPCAAPDHYEIIHDGSALTCAPEDVTIAACGNADCTTLLTTPTTVTLSPTGWVGGDKVTFTGSMHAQLIHTVAETVTLGMSAQSPPPVNGYRCTRTIGGPSVSCNMVYYDSGFDFAIPTQTSCKESGNITLSAIGRDPATGQCVPLFASRTENISFWSTYVNPNTGTEGVHVNGTTVAGASPGTPVSLSFDANGHSTFKVTYNDAGQVQLNARYLGSGSMAGLEMLGSDSFVTAPAGLCVYSDEANSDCASGDAACSVFKAAGASFALKVKGVCWQAAGETNAQFCDNATTANFRMDNIALTHTLVAPATGVSGNIAVSSANITAAGEAVVQQSVSEVGVFTFTADPPNDYLGAGDVFAGATFTSANIGRFIPHHFDVSIFPNPPGFADNCVGVASAFTYLGQPFNWAVVPSLTIQARNVAGAVTRNYEGGFWKLPGPLASYTYVDANVPVAASPLTPAASSQTLPDISNCNGTVTIPLIETNFNYTRPDMTVPVSPFVPDVSLSVTQSRLTDTDNVCYDLGAGAGCQGFVISGITGIHMRHGQIQVLNNFGPETADITNSPFEVRYYDGVSWVVNADDNCTTGLSFCPSGRISAIRPVPLASGKGTFTVSRPASVQVCLIAPPWLTALTDCTAPDRSCGEFTFGIYRGNDRIINWQEIMR